MAMNTYRTQVRLFNHFLYTFHVQFVHGTICTYLIVVTCLYIFMNISCMFVMYVLNILICVNELILFFLQFVQC